MHVKLLRPVPGFGYFENDTFEVADTLATEWINNGFAILVQPTEGDGGDECDLPDGLPSRNLLVENGFTTIEQILDAGETLTDIKGIGAKGVEAIITFCNEYQNSTK